MKKTLLFLALLMLHVSVTYAQKSFYDFKVLNINGDTVDLSVYKGKKILVVNTASKCGLTPQYAKLEKLYKDFGGSRFEIVAFPANDFMSQEPGTNAEIKEFCTKNYGVSFPVMAKVSVKGDSICPLYQWLTLKSNNGVVDAPVKWNFQKFLIDENGNLVGYLSPKVAPDSEKITEWIRLGTFKQE